MAIVSPPPSSAQAPSSPTTDVLPSPSGAPSPPTPKRSWWQRRSKLQKLLMVVGAAFLVLTVIRSLNSNTAQPQATPSPSNNPSSAATSGASAKASVAPTAKATAAPTVAPTPVSFTGQGDTVLRI